MAAELLKRLFITEIAQQLFPNNSFVNMAVNDDAFVNGNTVEIQNAGDAEDVIVDNTTWPLQTSQRTDLAHNYQIETLNTPVRQLTDVEALTEIGGANKRSSIVAQQAASLRTKASSRLLVDWLTGVTAKVPTTGSGAPASLPSATGNRRLITRADLLDGLELLADDDIEDVIGDEVFKPILICPPRFYKALTDIDDFIHADKMGRGTALMNGQIGEIYGITVVRRSLVATTDSSDTLKAEEAARAAGDQHAAILYHPFFVRKAMGPLTVRIQEDAPEWAGTIMGSEMRFGGTAARNDKKGIVMIFEDTV